MPLYLNDQGQWVDDDYGPAAPVKQWTGSQSDWDAYNNPVQARSPIDTQDFLRSFAYTQGAAQGTGELNRFLQGLVAKGFTGDDFVNGLEKYNQSQGLTYNRPNAGEYPADSFYTYNGNEHVPWWGEQKRIEAIGKGLDLLGKPTGWESQYNDALAQAQQNDVGRIGTQNQNNLPSDMDTFMDVLKFAGAAAGMYGLGGMLGGAAGGAASGASSLPSALSGAGSFEAGLGSTLGGNAGLGISGSLGSSAGGVLGGAGSFADIAAGGMLGGIGGAAGIGALPSIAAEGAAIGGVGSSGAAPDVVASGGGSSGGEMDWLDELINNTQGDPVWNTSGDLGSAIGGTNPYGGDLGLPNGTLPDGSVDVGASWQNQLQATLSGMPNLPPGLSSAIKALAGGGSGSSSLLGLLGKGLGGVLDYTASSKAADNAKEIADRTWGAGQQYRDNASRAMTPGFDLNSIPGYSGALSTGMDAFNRSLSAKNGNPWGQGGAAGEAISWAGKTIGLPAWQNYFNSNSNAGGLSNLATQSTTAGLNAGAADQATYGSLGQTARNIFDPQPNYQKQYLELLGKQYGLA